MGPNNHPRFATHGKVVVLSQKVAQLRVSVTAFAARVLKARVRLQAVFRQREGDGGLVLSPVFVVVVVASRRFHDDDFVGTIDDSTVSAKKLSTSAS